MAERRVHHRNGAAATRLVPTRSSMPTRRLSLRLISSPFLSLEGFQVPILSGDSPEPIPRHRRISSGLTLPSPPLHTTWIPSRTRMSRNSDHVLRFHPSVSTSTSKSFGH